MKLFLSLLLLLVCISLNSEYLYAASPSEMDIGFKGIGVRVGYVDPESSYDGTIGFGCSS